MFDIDRIKEAIRDIPDFPTEGIIFKDITPILGDPQLFTMAVDAIANRHINSDVRKIAINDARGFIFGAAIAYKLGIGLVPIRKAGKLPYETYEQQYELEYGTATLSLHVDAFEKGEKVVLVDDLLATGGTAKASADLIDRAGGVLHEIDFLIELSFLDGRDRLGDYPLFSLLTV